MYEFVDRNGPLDDYEHEYMNPTFFTCRNCRYNGTFAMFYKWDTNSYHY